MARWWHRWELGLVALLLVTSVVGATVPGDAPAPLTIGDRVTVIAPTDEYAGFSGVIVDATRNGDLVVDVEVPTRWRAVFKPHDLELEAIAKRRKRSS